MNENEFEWHGKKYIAKEIDCKCRECALYHNTFDCYHSPPCAPDQRKDRRNVIFVEVPKPEQKPEQKTNGDRIRGMSNKELADFLSDMTDCSSCATAIHNFCHANEHENCNAVILQWLNSPAEAGSEGK